MPSRSRSIWFIPRPGHGCGSCLLRIVAFRRHDSATIRRDHSWNDRNDILLRRTIHESLRDASSPICADCSATPRHRGGQDRVCSKSASRCCVSGIASKYLPARLSSAICAAARRRIGFLRERRSAKASAGRHRQSNDSARRLRDFMMRTESCLGRGGCRYPLARASPASLTSILRSSPGPVTRSGKSSRRVAVPACRSMPSGSQPVQLQSAASAPKSLVA